MIQKMHMILNHFNQFGSHFPKYGLKTTSLRHNPPKEKSWFFGRFVPSHSSRKNQLGPGPLTPQSIMIINPHISPLYPGYKRMRVEPHKAPYKHQPSGDVEASNRIWIHDTSSAAQGGGGRFKNRKPIGGVGCCTSWMGERMQ